LCSDASASTTWRAPSAPVVLQRFGGLAVALRQAEARTRRFAAGALQRFLDVTQPFAQARVGESIARPEDRPQRLQVVLRAFAAHLDLEAEIAQEAFGSAPDVFELGRARRRPEHLHHGRYQVLAACRFAAGDAAAAVENDVLVDAHPLRFEIAGHDGAGLQLDAIGGMDRPGDAAQHQDRFGVDFAFESPARGHLHGAGRAQHALEDTGQNDFLVGHQLALEFGGGGENGRRARLDHESTSDVRTRSATVWTAALCEAAAYRLSRGTARGQRVRLVERRRGADDRFPDAAGAESRLASPSEVEMTARRVEPRPRSRTGHHETGAPRRAVSLERALSKLGIASRVEARALIESGRVRVGARRIVEPGFRVDMQRDRISIDGATARRAALQIWMLHKPVGTVTTRRDPDGRRTVFDLLPAGLPHLSAVGRLDYDTSGLLLFTNDTQLGAFLTDPQTHVAKVYAVRLDAPIAATAAQQLAAGVEIRGRRTLPARVELCGPSPCDRLRVMLVEGRNRQVRRMFATLGRTVMVLHRERFGPLRLGDLGPGMSRPLREGELRELRALRAERRI
jgi:23S rRNA pseudouridine2605 synthase